MDGPETRQLSFDFDRPERNANRTDDALKEVGIGKYERALIWILLAHPEAEWFDLERKLRRLTISNRDAGNWLRSVPSPFGGLRLSRTAGKWSEAKSAWQQRGIVLIPTAKRRGTKTRLFGDLNALNTWWMNQIETRENELVSWLSDPGCSPVIPGDPLSEGEREGTNTNLSFNPSAGSPGITSPSLPPLPAAIYENQDGRKLYVAVRDWWQAEGLKHRGFDPDTVMGAILASFQAEAIDPQRYVQACLNRGVEDSWKHRAAAFRARHANDDKTYAPMGTTR